MAVLRVKTDNKHVRDCIGLSSFMINRLIASKRPGIIGLPASGARGSQKGSQARCRQHSWRAVTQRLFKHQRKKDRVVITNRNKHLLIKANIPTDTAQRSAGATDKTKSLASIILVAGKDCMDDADLEEGI
jgi:hypothetical protein